jgi:hypothetical protein
VTAGNASGVNDGSAALIIASEEAMKKYGLTPIARIVGGATAGVPPRIMGIGPAPATKKLCARIGWTPQDFDVIELNEAFASQGIAVLRDLGIAEDADHVNANGGAIALGHPLGMSGARITGTAALEMQMRGGKKALATMCIGVGQGIAIALENELQAITRMQPAVIFHASDRIATWRHPLSALRERLSALREQTGVLQFGGAVGDLQVLGDNAETVARSIASELGLSWRGHSWHSARSPVIAQANWMSELTGSLGKIGQDVALMALRGSEDIRMSGGGSSSAMPHKQNPVTAERLVTLARFNATLISGMYQAQIHELERSGAAWMLEWMLLPQICETAGASLSAASMLVQSIEHMGKAA